jgi:hypothetical protein
MSLRKAKTFVDKGRQKSQLEFLSSPEPLTSGLPSAAQSIRVPGASSGLTMKKQKIEKKVNVPAKIFEAVIMFLIMVSSVTLVMDNPLSDPEAPDIIFVGYLDNCFTVLFTVEMTVKIIAMGFLFSNATVRAKGLVPYLSNPWNQLDFIVVVSSLIDFIVMLQS